MATLYLKQSTAVTINVGPLVDATDGFTLETGLSPAAGDVFLGKNNGTPAAKNDATAPAHTAAGYYSVVLNTTDTNTVGNFIVTLNATGARPCRMEFQVGVGDYQPVDMVQIGQLSCTSGNVATLNLKQLDIQNNAGVAMVVATSNATSSAATFQGSTTGHGILTTGGATSGAGLRSVGGGTGSGAVFTSGSGATGDGVQMTAASTNGNGLNLLGKGSGSGLYTSGAAAGGGVGATFYGGGGNSKAVRMEGSGTGESLYLTSSGTNATLYVDNTTVAGPAVLFKGNGTNNPGLKISGIGIGAGAIIENGPTATTNAALMITASSTNSSAIKATGAGTGSAIEATGGVTGNGMKLVGGATSGAGLLVQGSAGNADGATFVAHGTGIDLNADNVTAIETAVDGIGFSTVSIK